MSSFQMLVGVAMRIMTEAVGSLVCGAGIKNIHAAGHLVVGTDANENCFARYLCDEFYPVPMANDPNSHSFLKNLVIDRKIDLVIPSLDEGMLFWSQIKEKLKTFGVAVAISNEDTIRVCEDKWETYIFFMSNGISTPKTSLVPEYPLIKPRQGRGGEGVLINQQVESMDGMISQEVLHGDEYTVDVLCNLDGKPIYIVPRRRLGIKEGKSTSGIVVKNDNIIDGIKKICNSLRFKGAINIQCFDDPDRGVCFTEINPRWGGGTALSMAATENWIPLIIDLFVHETNPIGLSNVNYGLKMGRYYSEVYYK